MERTVLRASQVTAILDRMVKVKLYTDGADPSVEANQLLQEQRFKTVALPLYVILDADGREIARVNQKVGEEEFTAFLKKARLP